jgi:hypothetical protein
MGAFPRVLASGLCLLAVVCWSGITPTLARSSTAEPTWPPMEETPEIRPELTLADSVIPPSLRDFATRSGYGMRLKRSARGYQDAARPMLTAEGASSSDLWHQLPVLTGREGQSIIYDPLRARIIVFGGWDGAQYRNDVWTLSLTGPPTWSHIATAGNPPAGRVGHGAVYDSALDCMLVFGGYSDQAPGSFLSDVWELSLGGTPTWSLVPPRSDSPQGRCFHSLVYDSPHDRLLVFGGSTGAEAPQYLNDVWALTLSDSASWLQLTPGGTPPIGRHAHAAIYDPSRGAMIAFGGYYFAGTSHYLNDIWQLSFAGDSSWWSPVTALGTPPAGRAGHSAIWDPAREQMAVFGGDYWDGSYHFLSDAWTLTLDRAPAWTRIATSTAAPNARSGQVAIYDPARDSMLVAGGYSYDGAYDFYCDVWALALAGTPGWSPWAPAGRPPQGREQAAAVIDPLRGQFVVFGGTYNDGVTHYLNDVWSMSLTDPPNCAAFAVAGTSPVGRFGHSAIYDPARNRILVFGGYYYGGGYHYLNDLWVLTLTGTPTWTQITPAGNIPSPRAGQTAVYDPLRDRMVVFGGYSYDGSYHYFNDAWSLSLGEPPVWSQIPVGGTLPPARAGHAAVYDPVRDRLLVSGGYYFDTASHYLGDAWALSFGASPTWAALARDGTWPGPRAGHAAVYDALGDRMWILGGYFYDTGPHVLNDSWALDLADNSAWWPLSQPSTAMPQRSGHSGAYDQTSGRIVVFGGKHGASSYLQDVWVLEPAKVVSVPAEPHPVSLSLSQGRPTPSRGAVAVTFVLPHPAIAWLRILDLAGRSVATPQHGILSAGAHVVSWDGKDDAGRSVPAGVYFCDLRVDREHLTRRLVVMR